MITTNYSKWSELSLLSKMRECNKQILALQNEVRNISMELDTRVNTFEKKKVINNGKDHEQVPVVE